MFIRSIMSGFAVLLLASSAHASVINGDFSAATSLDGWSFIGNVGEIDPADPGERAMLNTASGSTDKVAINAALGIDIDAVTSGFAGGGTFANGSFLYQTFSVSGIGTLTFDVNFLSSEGGPGPDNVDFAFGVITGMGIELLAQWPGDTGGPAQSGFTQSSGFFTESVILGAGTYTLGVGVVNVNNTFKNSGLLIDNVTLVDVETAVPLPATAALLGLGLVGLRRRMG